MIYTLQVTNGKFLISSFTRETYEELEPIPSKLRLVELENLVVYKIRCTAKYWELYSPGVMKFIMAKGLVSIAEVLQVWVEEDPKNHIILLSSED